jgi:hypothetical protein
LLLTPAIVWARQNQSPERPAGGFRMELPQPVNNENGSCTPSTARF